MIGRTIGHYKILEKLGAGGMGEVFLADDSKLERQVAIKFLPTHLTKDSSNVERFKREAQAAAALNHPNIITIHDIIETTDPVTSDTQICIVMEYVDGKSLRDVLAEFKLGFVKIRDIFQQICTGLQQAHQAGIVHRDVKPENIIVGRDGRIRIVDFGLAKLKGVSKLTKETATLGTLHYMSPEQTRGESVDHRSDIWSLGVVLYEMVAGQLPFTGDYDQAVAYSITNDAPQPLTESRPDLPVELEQIINRTLAKNPQNRYQDTGEILTELNRIQEGQTESQKPTPPKIKKSLYLPAIVLSVFVLVIAGYFWLTADKADSADWENSIAVLPFDNISNDPDQEYFCDGMTEQLITNLAKLSRLKVIGRTSVIKFKNTDKSLTEIGQELNVAHILEGSVRKDGEKIRVTAQLINTADGSHLWAEDYDRKLENIFAIQDDVAQKISRILFRRLSGEKQNELKPQIPVNTEAYDYYLKGKFFLRKYEHFERLSDLHRAEELLKASLDHDPNHAATNAYLSDVYGTFAYAEPAKRSEYIGRQEKYINIAMRLDSNSADVLSKKAFLYQNKNDPEKRFKYRKKALSIEPNHFASNLQMGIFLRNYGLADYSLKYFDKAIEINPLDPWDYCARGMAYAYLGQFEKAEKDYRTALEIESSDYWTLYFYTEFLLMLRRIEEARILLKQFENEHPEKGSVKYCKSLLLAYEGDRTNSLRLLDESGYKGIEQVYIYCILGDTEHAFGLLTELQQRMRYHQMSIYLELQNMPWYDNLRADPRFEALLTRQKQKYEENLLKYGNGDF